MKTQLTQTKQLSLLETQGVSGAILNRGPLGPSLDPHNVGTWPMQPSFINIMPNEYVTLAIHENGGKTPFVF